MFEEENKLKIFTTTLRDVINNLSKIKDCSLENFKEEVEEAFDGYEYEDIDEITGYDSWGDISKNGKYELNIKIDHENAYELTMHTSVENNKATITNIL
jgi:hypothetical protein